MSAVGKTALRSGTGKTRGPFFLFRAPPECPYERGGESLAFEPNSRERSIALRLNCNGELSDIEKDCIYCSKQGWYAAGQALPCNWLLRSTDESAG
jgi:hypothetical protein